MAKISVPATEKIIAIHFWTELQYELFASVCLGFSCSLMDLYKKEQKPLMILL